MLSHLSETRNRHAPGIQAIRLVEQSPNDAGQVLRIAALEHRAASSDAFGKGALIGDDHGNPQSKGLVQREAPRLRRARREHRDVHRVGLDDPAAEGRNLGKGNNFNPVTHSENLFQWDADIPS